MKIQVQSFKGVAPKIPARYLPDGMAQTAVNVETLGHELKLLHAPGESVATLAHSGDIQTIYRFGQDLDTDTEHWFAWAADVDVCRGQIAGDPAEWTFYTGDEFPKATTNSLALGTAPPVEWRRLGIPAPTIAPVATVVSSRGEQTGETQTMEDGTVVNVTTIVASGTQGTQTNASQGSGGTPARIVVTADVIEEIHAPWGVDIALDGVTWGKIAVADNSAGSLATAWSFHAGATAVVDAGNVVITQDTPGGTLGIRYATFDEIANGTAGVVETRVYVYTWISDLDGLTMESAPSPASNLVDVYYEDPVELTGLIPTPGGAGIAVTGIRLYRATAGVYLFLEEISNGQNNYTDVKRAEELGEELPSLSWQPAPDDLKGLINLPNGVLAGFTGRDVWFSDVYRPYAWPVEYMQTVDAPVVGLGRMDTTLAVLTKGNPYFIQGSDPALMTVVKSDLEQSCVSKRSIVSLDGAVYYASPDGLMRLSSGGSVLATQAMYTAEQWREAFTPESIHAYGYDGKYIGFYRRADGIKGGFIYDTYSQQFMRHELWYPAGYTDLKNDTLYLLWNESILQWEKGLEMTGTWRSKRFSLPQRTGFSCAQVEAEGYPVTFKLYAHGQHFHQEVVTSRAPFRLPAGQYRDWEIELMTSNIVFNVLIAQSMSEIASG